jgi:hypothetical protein
MNLRIRMIKKRSLKKSRRGMRSMMVMRSLQIILRRVLILGIMEEVLLLLEKGKLERIMNLRKCLLIWMLRQRDLRLLLEDL